MNIRWLNIITYSTILILAPIISSYGQDIPKQTVPDVWNLATCIDYARKNNITVKSLQLTSKSSEQNLQLSKSAVYPNLTANAISDISNKSPLINSNSNYSLNTSVSLYNGHYLKNDIKSKELSLQASDLDIETAQNDIILQITQAYLNILLSNENIKYLEDLVKTSEAQVLQAEQKNKIGSLANKDLLQLQSSLMNDKYNLVTAENSKRQNILSLKQLLQLPGDLPFEVVIPDSVDVSKELPPLQEVEKQAVKIMPQIKSSLITRDIQDLEIKKAKAGYYPDITLNGFIATGYDYTGKTLDGFSSTAYTTGLNSNFNQQIGLSLSIPLSNRKATRVSIAKANIQKEQSELNLQNEITNLDQNVERAYINVKNARSQFTAAEEQLKYNEELYRIANEQIKIGIYNNVEYLQQKNQYLQAIQAFTEAKYSCILYQKIYNFYNGVPVTQ